MQFILSKNFTPFREKNKLCYLKLTSVLGELFHVYNLHLYIYIIYTLIWHQTEFPLAPNQSEYNRVLQYKYNNDRIQYKFGQFKNNQKVISLIRR